MQMVCIYIRCPPILLLEIYKASFSDEIHYYTMLHSKMMKILKDDLKLWSNQQNPNKLRSEIVCCIAVRNLK